MKRSVYFMRFLRRSSRCSFMRVPAVVVALAVAAMSGCVSTKYYPVKGAKPYPPTEKLAAYRDYPDRPYEILGIVTASGHGKEKRFSRLKEKAMAIGADAVVMKRSIELTNEYVSEMRVQFFTTETRLEAVAIKFIEGKQTQDE